MVVLEDLHWADTSTLDLVVCLDQSTQDVLRLVAAAGRDVGYPLLRATAGLRESELRKARRRAVEAGVLVPEPETGSFRPATRSRPRRSTARPCPESARSYMRGWRRYSSAAQPREQRSWHHTGRWRAATADALHASLALARQVGARLGQSKFPASGSAARLVLREGQVLTLVARGHTDREIAAALTLTISIKTASVHVSHLLRKPDVPNRLEAAAIAHRLTPPAAPSGPDL
jgi:DNA-binding CsgD family transcriptional regulator